MGKKGKAQGRAGKKQKAQSQRHDGPRAHAFASSRSHQAYPDEDEDDFPHVMFRGFTQAQDMTSPQRPTTLPLRHQKIAFISAGIDKPLEEPSPSLAVEAVLMESEDMDATLVMKDRVGQDIDDDEESKGDSVETNIIIETTEIDVPEGDLANMHIHGAEAAESPPFVIDTVGDDKLVGSSKFRAKKVAARSPSPTPSNSSQEVVVFHGRGKPIVVDDPPAPKQPLSVFKPSSGTPVARSSPHVTDDLIRALQGPQSQQDSGWITQRPKYEGEVEGSDAPFVPAPDTPYWKTESHAAWPGQGVNPSQKLAINAAPAASSRVEGTSSSRRSKNQRKKGNRNMRSAIVDDEDGGSEAAYDDYMANLAAQLDGSGDDGSGIGAVAATFGSRPLALEDGPSFDMGDATEVEVGSEWEDEDTGSSLHPDPEEQASVDSQLDASDELESDLEYNEREQWEDEEDLRQRRNDAMTDEQIARLLAKQEEFGILGDELVIDDGAYVSMDDGVGDVEAARAGLADLTNTTRSMRGIRTKSKAKKGQFTYPDATLLADVVDQYGDAGFDIMDFDRPSLRPTKKGRKGHVPSPLEALSDDDLRDNMTMAWENDREKKRLQKLEREELRAQGLLGAAGRKGVADLKQKYPFGMTAHDMKTELVGFLSDDGLQQRAFPPMLKQDRKDLHDICNRLGLKSQSQGSGKNRFPVVSKTKKTISADSPQIRRVFDRASRPGGFGGPGGNKKAAKTGAGRGGGFGKAAVTLRHGEVVGAGAAEISSSSFGHRLMEKMGWSKGMALGKDGEGRLVPVEQVVRIGTAGLG